MSFTRELELRLPASHESVRIARRLVRMLAVACGVSRAQIDELKLVLSELLGNAVDHGRGGGVMNDADARVTMEFRFAVEDERWTLAVTDHGGAKADDVRDFLGNDLPDFENERGRGFFLLEQMLDELSVEDNELGDGLVFHASRRLTSSAKQ